MVTRSRAANYDERFVDALRAQKRRTLAALVETPRLDADPILRDGESLDGEAYATLVYELHHVHLPELAAAGIVEFDRREETVRRGAHFRRSSSVTRPR